MQNLIDEQLNVVLDTHSHEKLVRFPSAEFDGDVLADSETAVLSRPFGRLGKLSLRAQEDEGAV